MVKILPLETYKEFEEKIQMMEDAITQSETLKEQVSTAKTKYRKFIEQKINNYFNATTINDIYQKIDPHPTQKMIKLTPEFEGIKTMLRVKTISETGEEEIDPILYNSSGQVSILSLSIFLAKALQTNQFINTVFLDDPIQYLDAINVLSFIDLLRTIITNLNRQIVISTHDKNFYQLLQKKLDPDFYNTKFIELESYGKIKEGNQYVDEALL